MDYPDFFILTNRLKHDPNNPDQIARNIKEISKQQNKAFPNKDLARECRKLNLIDLLASHEMGHPSHSSVFMPNSKL